MGDPCRSIALGLAQPPSACSQDPGSQSPRYLTPPRSLRSWGPGRPGHPTARSCWGGRGGGSSGDVLASPRTCFALPSDFPFAGLRGNGLKENLDGIRDFFFVVVYLYQSRPALAPRRRRPRGSPTDASQGPRRRVHYGCRPIGARGVGVRDARRGRAGGRAPGGRSGRGSALSGRGGAGRGRAGRLTPSGRDSEPPLPAPSKRSEGFDPLTARPYRERPWAGDGSRPSGERGGGLAKWRVKKRTERDRYVS